jgi:hypothetical protein
MPYWCAQTEGNREHVAERILQMAGYEVCFPRILERGLSPRMSSSHGTVDWPARPGPFYAMVLAAHTREKNSSNELTSACHPAVISRLEIA